MIRSWMILASVGLAFSTQAASAQETPAACKDAIEWRLGSETNAGPQSKVFVDFENEGRFVVWAVGPNGMSEVIATREDGSTKRYAMHHWTPIFFDAKKVEIAVTKGATGARGCIRQIGP